MRTKKLSLMIVGILIALSFSFVSYAQEWDEEQNEVWQHSKQMHQYWAERDLNAYMNCLHENYVGWFHKNPLPIDKNSLRKWEAINFDTQVIHRYEIRPISITITGNVAVVNFYFNALREDVNGKKMTHTKVTRFCIKEEEKWLVLGVRTAQIGE